MAKVRSVAELIDYLDAESAWRKRELTTCKFLVEGRRRRHEQDLLIRSFTCIQYAHWEGFVKRAAEAYLGYIQATADLSNLRECFVAVHNMRHIQRCGRITRKWATHYTTLVSDLHTPRGKLCVDGSAVDTESNLSLEILEQILAMLGISLASIPSLVTSGPLLDQELVGNRNAIAHGERTRVPLDDFLKLHARLVVWIETIKTEIVNAASRGLHLKQAATA